MRFMGDPAVTAQFQTCPGFDPAKNNVNKIAGISRTGDPVLDPCFCAAFCEDAVTATVAHEKMHRPTILIGVIGQSDFFAGCTLGILKGAFCGALEATILASSEVASHEVGIASLGASIDKLKANDPSKPGMACTWMPIAEPAVPPPPAPPPPAGFVDRVRLLFDRILHGAKP
jgi:hypothetical protein